MGRVLETGAWNRGFRLLLHEPADGVRENWPRLQRPWVVALRVACSTGWAGLLMKVTAGWAGGMGR